MGIWLRPVVHQVAAQAFRAFWGDKSELRRFKDGTILEAVIWDASDSILVQIARHLLQRHLAIPVSLAGEVALVGAPLLGTLCPHEALWQRLPASTARLTALPPVRNSDAHTAAEPLRAAFDELTAKLQAASLPLTIVSTTPVHAAFRSCAVWVPSPVALGSSDAAELDALPYLSADGEAPTRARFGVEALDVVLQFESSSRWPDDLTAIARLKTAFYLRIAQGTAHAPAGKVVRVSVCVGCGGSCPSPGKMFVCLHQFWRIKTFWASCLKILSICHCEDSSFGCAFATTRNFAC